MEEGEDPVPKSKSRTLGTDLKTPEDLDRW